MASRKVGKCYDRSSGLFGNEFGICHYVPTNDKPHDIVYFFQGNENISVVVHTDPKDDMRVERISVPETALHDLPTVHSLLNWIYRTYNINIRSCRPIQEL